jgi:hypothetical protein
MRLKELNEEGQALNDWVGWWKSASIKALEEAQTLSDEEEDMVTMDDEFFNKNMAAWHRVQTKIDYLDKDGAENVRKIKKFKGEVSNYILRKAFLTLKGTQRKLGGKSDKG